MTNIINNNIQFIKNKNTFYINLDHRTDRREHVEHQLQLLGLYGQRFPAIKMDDGAIGCSFSHLKILQYAFINNLEHVLIIEDDILFQEPEIFVRQFNKLIQNKSISWDVILFGGNNMPPYSIINDTCVKVNKCQTTTGYLVNGHYIKTLINNIRDGLSLLLKYPSQKSLYAIDKYWFILQQKDNWYLITPLTVVQKEGYSDIEHKHTDYTKCMIDLDKKELFDAIKKHKNIFNIFKK